MANIAGFFGFVLHALFRPLFIPNWKRIGWHLGKRLKDILHGAPDTGPSKEERLAQRRQDVLKGFAYFDTFEELENWRPEDVDPIQIANTPLLPRQELVSQGITGLKPSKILLCHDYKGGYHDYESIRPVDVDVEDYTCEYLQYIDTFIYFSHKLVCVPPPTWINLLHRNGVKVLGTFIVEPQSIDVDRILQETDGNFLVAKQLACMADTFGFDGWLLNIEKKFPKHTEDRTNRLVKFIESLKQHAGDDKQVIWYDALTIDNEVEHQNGLTSNNLPFARASDALFTNYKWMPANVFEARRIAKEHNISAESIFFGIDVWAQSTNMSGPPRVTYPPEGGGGTNTGVAVNALGNLNFPTAIFAPAWTFEHFHGQDKESSRTQQAPPPGRLLEQTMWEGANLPENVKCDCKRGMQQHRMHFQNHPITRHAREYPAGSALYFETNFNRAYSDGRQEDAMPHDGPRYSAQLGAQSILPHLLPMSRKAWDNLHKRPPAQVLYGEILDGRDERGVMIYCKDVGQAKHKSPTSMPAAPKVEQGLKAHRLRLFNLNMPTSTSLTAHITYDRPRSSRNIKLGFYLAYSNPGPQASRSYTYHRSPYAPDNTITQTIPISTDPSHDQRLVELGAYVHTIENTTPEPRFLLCIQHITIKPTSSIPTPSDYEITDLHITTRGITPYTQKRLAWTFHSDYPSHAKITGIPYSRTTGPFSHFLILLNGRRIGTAHACEFPLLRRDFDARAPKDGEGEVDAEVEIQVQGVLFGCRDRVLSAVLRVTMAEVGEEAGIGGERER